MNTNEQDEESITWVLHMSARSCDFYYPQINGELDNRVEIEWYKDDPGGRVVMYPGTMCYLSRRFDTMEHVKSVAERLVRIFREGFT